jgi:hypothetical protein
MTTAYKTQIQNLKPKMFITFDGDPFDPHSGALSILPPVLIDESGHSNIGLMQGDPLGYALGQTSLVEVEVGGVFSAVFGQAGFYSSGDAFPKAYIEVPNSSDFNFTTQFGSFSVALFVEKTQTESNFRSHPEVGWPSSGTNYTSLFRPIISKGPVLTIGFVDNVASAGGNAQYLTVIDPTGFQQTIQIVTDFAPFLGDQKHIVYVWNVVQTSPGLYTGTSTLFINGIKAFTNSYNFTFTYPDTASPASWFIAGAPSAVIAGDPAYNFGDRTTSPTLFDQIAVFDYGLSDLQVTGLFKKTRSYDRMVLARQPYAYFPFEDPEIAGVYSVANLGVGGTGNGTLYGGSSLVHRRFTGPPIPTSNATQFANGGMGELNVVGQSFPVVTGDVTIETWFNVSSGDRGILFAMPQNEYFPFDGPLCQMNWANDQATPGAFQFNMRQDLSVSTPAGLTWNDGLWHHLACIRRGTFLEIWIDGLIQATSPTFPINSTSNTSYNRSLFVMGMLPEKLSLNGLLSKFAVHYRALDGYELVMRSTYAMAYRIFGGITLQTNPVAANIRVYRHFDGSLVTTGISDAVTGKFQIDVPNYDKYDLMILEGSDPTVRYRAYGPMTPTAYPDTAL